MKVSKLLPFVAALALIGGLAAMPQGTGVFVHKTLVTNDSVTDTLLKNPTAGLYRTTILLRTTDSDTVVADTAFARNIKAGIICKNLSYTYAQNTDTIPTGVAAAHSKAGRQKGVVVTCFAQDSAILYKVTKTTATGKLPYVAYFMVERIR